MGKRYQVERLILKNLEGLGDEPFIVEVSIQEEEGDPWLVREIRGRAYFDPYNFDNTFTIELYDVDDPDLYAYLRRKLKEDFEDLVKKSLR